MWIKICLCPLYLKMSFTGYKIHGLHIHSFSILNVALFFSSIKHYFKKSDDNLIFFPLYNFFSFFTLMFPADKINCTCLRDMW